jgi:HD-GYP domain-containing protein (c-di-GMP phosphodiesterase class II)
MPKLIFFTENFNPEEYDKKSLPVDIYNSTGTILAKKGQKLSKDRLRNSYIQVEDSDFESNLELDEFDGDVIEILNELKDTENKIEKSIEDEAESRSAEESVTSDNIRSGDTDKNLYLLSDDYEDESGDKIEKRLDKLDFMPLRDVKIALRANVHQIKEIFEKNIVNNVASLTSANNESITRNIAGYLDYILDNTIYASDYMDMISSIRNEDNYLTFSHACSVAFYSLAIAKKLKLLKEDISLNNVGKWIPQKTSKHDSVSGHLYISNQMLKYVDHQKINIQMKYKSPIKEILFENLNDLLYEYAIIEKNKNYPSFEIDFELLNREIVTMAALNADIGKIMLPNSVLNKKSKLTYKEYLMMSKHPIYSVAKLKEVGVNNSTMFAYILGHHRLNSERGYPPIKKALPYEAKIIAIADIYDAMRAPKHHGNVLSQIDIFKHLKELYEENSFDDPLYIAAIHTFDEYNHEYVKRRIKSSVE